MRCEKDMDYYAQYGMMQPQHWFEAETETCHYDASHASVYSINDDFEAWQNWFSSGWDTIKPLALVRADTNQGEVGEDQKDPFREYGGTFGTDANGNERVVWAAPGERTDPSKASIAESSNLYKAANPNEQGVIQSYTGTFHTHPSGTVSTGGLSASGGTTYSIGGSSGQHSFVQKVSATDITNAAKGYTTGNNYVLGAGNNTVYIYNGSGVQATFPLDKFGSVE